MILPDSYSNIESDISIASGVNSEIDRSEKESIEKENSTNEYKLPIFQFYSKSKSKSEIDENGETYCSPLPEKVAVKVYHKLMLKNIENFQE